jgi:hypothetical protein
MRCADPPLPSRLKARGAFGDHADDDRIRTCRTLRRQQCRAEADGIIRVRIDPDDKAGEVAVLLDSSVDAAALNSPMVVQDRDTAVASRALPDNMQRPVGAAAVTNDDLAHGVHWFCYETGERILDMSFFIEARNNHHHGRRWRRILVRCHQHLNVPVPQQCSIP